VLFQLLNNLHGDELRRFWSVYREVKENACDIREDLGQMAMEVKIAFPVSDKTGTCLAMPSIGNKKGDHPARTERSRSRSRSINETYIFPSLE
jgi:hypothetical protein